MLILSRRLRPILFLALLLRLLAPALAVAFSHSGKLLTSDSRHYLDLGNALATGQGFSSSGDPEVWRPPGYPLQLAVGSLIGFPLLAAVLLQALFGTATVGLGAILAHRLAGSGEKDRAAVLAALGSAVDPTLLCWTGRIMAEPLLGLAVAALTVALLNWLRDPRPSRLALVAALASVAAYVKPVAWPLPLWLATIVAIAAPPPWRRRLQSGALVFAMAAVMLAPWHLRNGLLTGYWGFSSQIDHVVSVGAAAALTAERDGVAFSQEREQVRRGFPRGPNVATGQEERRRAGLSAIAASPLIAARIHATGMARSLLLPGTLSWVEYFGHRRKDLSKTMLDEGLARTWALADRPVLLLTAALLPVALLLPFLALRGLWRTRNRTALLVGAIASWFVLAGGGPWGQSRFRFPIVPLLWALSVSSPRQRAEQGFGKAAIDVAALRA